MAYFLPCRRLRIAMDSVLFPSLFVLFLTMSSFRAEKSHFCRRCCVASLGRSHGSWTSAAGGGQDRTELHAVCGRGPRGLGLRRLRWAARLISGTTRAGGHWEKTFNGNRWSQNGNNTLNHGNHGNTLNHGFISFICFSFRQIVQSCLVPC